MTCPVCGANTTGQIGRGRYYCGECCHEWVAKGNRLKIFKISSDGKLYNLKAQYESINDLNCITG